MAESCRQAGRLDAAVGDTRPVGDWSRQSICYIGPDLHSIPFAARPDWSSTRLARITEPGLAARSLPDSNCNARGEARRSSCGGIIDNKGSAVYLLGLIGAGRGVDSGLGREFATGVSGSRTSQYNPTQ
jgi:hypothetical protein